MKNNNEKIDKQIQKIDKKLNKKYPPIVFEIFENIISRQIDRLTTKKESLEREREKENKERGL